MSKNRAIVRELQDKEVDFVLTYLRHNYFRKTENPDTSRIKQFEDTANNISEYVYFKHTHHFSNFGFELDDVKNIALCHVISFIGMQGLQENPDEMQKFMARHTQRFGVESKPTADEMFRYEAFGISAFIKQRLNELAFFCSKKARNIKVYNNTTQYFISTREDCVDPACDYDLTFNPEHYGFKKITQLVFKEIVESVGGHSAVKGKKRFVDNLGRVLRVVTLHDYKNQTSDCDVEVGEIVESKESFYGQDPEEILIAMDTLRDRFISKSNAAKKKSFRKKVV